MTPLSFLMDLLDHYASFRIRRSVLLNLIRAKLTLGLSIDSESAEYMERFLRWEYCIETQPYDNHPSFWTVQIDEIEPGLFRTRWRHSIWGTFDESLFTSLSEAASILFPELQRYWKIVFYDYADHLDRQYAAYCLE